MLRIFQRGLVAAALLSAVAAQAQTGPEVTEETVVRQKVTTEETTTWKNGDVPVETSIHSNRVYQQDPSRHRDDDDVPIFQSDLHEWMSLLDSSVGKPLLLLVTDGESGRQTQTNIVAAFLEMKSYYSRAMNFRIINKDKDSQILNYIGAGNVSWSRENGESNVLILVCPQRLRPDGIPYAFSVTKYTIREGAGFNLLMADIEMFIELAPQILYTQADTEEFMTQSSKPKVLLWVRSIGREIWSALRAMERVRAKKLGDQFDFRIIIADSPASAYFGRRCDHIPHYSLMNFELFSKWELSKAELAVGGSNDSVPLLTKDLEEMLVKYANSVSGASRIPSGR